MKISDLIFRELIKRGYSKSDGKRVWDIADSKLWYLTPEQAQAYLDLQATSEYKTKLGSKEVVLIKENLGEIVKSVGNEPINVVDLGCGDGKKVVLFLETLNKKVKVRYCPIDISGYMVNKAIEKISKLNAGEIVESHWNISDFENLENVTDILTKQGYKRNLFLLLGNTLGNFEIHDMMYKVRSAMKDGDMLVIGNGLDNGKLESGVLKFVREERGNDKFLGHIPSLLGLDKKNVKFGVRFANSRIEFYYDILKNQVVRFQNKSVDFKKGDEIIVAVSYHLKKDDFKSFVKLYFGESRVFTTDDDSYALALCTK